MRVNLDLAEELGLCFARASATNGYIEQDSAGKQWVRTVLYEGVTAAAVRALGYDEGEENRFRDALFLAEQSERRRLVRD